MNLYEISQEWQELERLLMESGGELTEELEELLGELMTAEVDKIGGYLMVRANFKMLAEGAKAEADRLARKSKTALASIKRMEERLADYMESTGKDSIEHALGKVRLQYASQAPFVMDVKTEELPLDFTTERTIVDANKDALKLYLKSDSQKDRETVEAYCHFGEKSKFIRIY